MLDITKNIDWIYYLKIIPWNLWEEQLINSIKSDLNAFHIKNIWFWLETYFFKINNNLKLEQYITANSLEWINYAMNFFIKLYSGKVWFSLTIKSRLIQYKNYNHTYKIWLNNHSTLQIKKLGSLWWDTFLTSSSIHWSIFQEISSFIKNNEIIKTSFYFTKWEYSRFYKDFIYSQKTRTMSEEEEQSFMSSFSENQNMFLFRWKISHNLEFRDTKSIIIKNILLYSSLYNSYQIRDTHSFWNYIWVWKRLLQPEAILSQWLFVPINNNFSQNMNSQNILPSSSFYKENLII
jgi:hypothetical protein